MASNSGKKWVQLFQKKYVKHRNFIKMQCPKSASWVAMSIFKCKDVLSNGLCHKIGNGWGTCIWEDPWVLDIPRFIPSSSNDASSRDVYVAYLIDHDSRQWDHGKLLNLFDTETARKILKINLPHHQQNDQIFWCLSRSGSFPLKSAYMSIIQPQLTGPNPLSIKEWRGLWKLKVHARFKNLLWKIVWRMLPVGEELEKRFHIPSTACFLCKNAVETIEHIFLQCLRTSQVWLLAPWSLNMSNLPHIDIIEWIKCIIDPKTKLGIRYEESLHFQLYASVVCDRIWMQRNKARMGEDIGLVVDLARKIQSSFNEQKAVWDEVRGKKLKLIGLSWIPPPVGWVKLNFDAAIRENKTTVVVVGRDNHGRVVLAWTDILDSGSPLWGEAKAAYVEVNKAVEAGLKRVIIEGDAWNVIDPLKDKKSSSEWTIDVILQNILALCNLFDDVSFSFVKREGNFATHLLAFWAAFCNNSGPVSISDPSLLVAQVLERDGQRPMSSMLYRYGFPFVK